MTVPLAIWKTLGIAPTGEVREIRRGYAKALKQIDVDQEPKRFAALREAFEEALALAEAGLISAEAPIAPDQWEADDRWLDAETPSPRIIETTTSFEPAATAIDQLPEPAQTPPDIWRQAAIDHVNQHGTDLEILLLANREQTETSSPEEAAAMIEHWLAITKDPRMEDLGHFAATEAWISEIIAHACPFSDPLIPYVADFYGWIEKAALIGESRAVQFIVRRRATILFEQAITDRSHPLNRAWRELIRPATERSRRGWFVKRKDVLALLNKVRTDLPELEHRFDSWRVGLWENEQQAIAFGGVTFAIILIGMLFRVLIYANAPESYPTTPSQIVADDRLTAPREDIDRIVKLLSHDYVNASEVAARNPDLYNDLTRLWDKTKESNGNVWDFQAAIGEIIRPRLNRVIGKADYQVLRSHMQVRLEEAQFFRSQGVRYCDASLTGKSVAINLPTELVDRYRNSIYDILLSTGADRPNFKPARTFAIPSSLVASAARAAKLDRETFLAAVIDKGTPSQRCDARIALMSEVLKLPRKSGLPLLRSM